MLNIITHDQLFIRSIKRNSEDNQFLKESLLIKLNDEDPTVVSAVLELSEVSGYHHLLRVTHAMNNLRNRLNLDLAKSRQKTISWKNLSTGK
jgi:hypothetical protein